MTPEQHIKQHILVVLAKWKNLEFSLSKTPEEIEILYKEAKENDYSFDDAVEQIREGQFETHLKAEDNKYYEGQSVAIKTEDGKWIGWTYWTGGGKYGTPQQEEWMNKSYFLKCVEKEKVVTVREFTLDEE
jgi:hypothetical protein